jgi:hypothetical protein
VANAKPMAHPPSRSRALPVALALLALLVAPAPTSADDGVPEVTAQPAQVDAGETFDLEVSVHANANGTYRVAFDARQYFSFPGAGFQEVMMVPDDTHIFRVPCRVAMAAPDDEYVMLFNLTWTVNGTERKVPGTLTVTVGQGEDGEVCTTSVMLACAAAVAPLALVRSRRRRA